MRMLKTNLKQKKINKNKKNKRNNKGRNKY